MHVLKLFNICHIMKKLVGFYYVLISIETCLLDIWSLGCVLYHMLTLVPPFFTSNVLMLASKICSGQYDQAPLKCYSERMQQIISECLCIDPENRPDICSVAKLCTEQIMTYTDRSCMKAQALEKRLRQQDHQREFDLIRQISQSQQHPSFQPLSFSCSSAKESLGGNSGGIADVSFDGADGQHDVTKPDAFAAGKYLK